MENLKLKNKDYFYRKLLKIIFFFNLKSLYLIKDIKFIYAIQ